MEWILDPVREGIYMMQVVDDAGYSGHVICIDTNRRLVYDSYLGHPLMMDVSSDFIKNVIFYCCEGYLACRGVRNVYKVELWN